MSCLGLGLRVLGFRVLGSVKRSKTTSTWQHNRYLNGKLHAEQPMRTLLNQCHLYQGYTMSSYHPGARGNVRRTPNLLQWLVNIT